MTLKSFTEDEAFALFTEWYERCIFSGIEPEKIVEQMGGMMLITDPDFVETVREWYESNVFEG